MDLKDYSELKDAGHVVVNKYENDVGITVTEFNPQTGNARPPVFQKLDIEGLKKDALNHRKLADQLDMLVADLEALKNA